MSNNIDNLFKKALQEQKCEPPARVWENIERQLDKPKRVVGGWWWRGVAAAALIIASVGIWQLNKQDVSLPQTEFVHSSTPAVLPENPVDFTLKSGSNDLLVASNAEMESVNEMVEQPTISRNQITPAQVFKSESENTVSNTPITESIIIKDVRRNFIPLTSKEALKNNQTYQALLNDEPEEKKTAEKVKIALSGHFTPAYSSGSYSSSVQNTRGYDYSDNQMSGLMNLGGGLKLSVSTGKRFSIQTGVFYSRMGQETSENNRGPRKAALSLNARTSRMATPLGNIKTNRKAVAYRSSEAIVLNSIADNDETLEQVFGTVEIPLHVRYRLNDNKVLFSLTGGFSGNIIVNNKVYMKNGSDKELLGSTEDIRNFNMSTDWGLGVEYPVSRRIKIMLEPGFKYYLQSLSRNSQIDFKPYMFTLSTGIGIEF